jgi:GntR family transcriptional repressor for pyruvate dehydrogenase complex
MTFRAVVRSPVYLQVAEQLREAILAGELAPGDALPTERELSQSFGVSRASVREALRALEAQGLISAGGAPVRAVVAGEVDGPASKALVNLLRLNAVSLRDLVEFRCTLEAAAVRLAAAARESARLEEARRALDEMRAADISAEAFDDADVRFHVALVRASGNEAMHLVMLALRNAVARHLLEALHSQPDGRATLRRLAREHEAILSALEAGDGERAAEFVTDHIRGFYQDYVRAPDGDATTD